MVDSVTKWLEQLGLGQYATSFAKNDIDWELLPELDQETLIHIGVRSAGHRLRIIKAVKSTQADSGGVTQSLESAVESRDPPASHGEAERRQLTVMFCDLVGSTALSQELDPEDLADVMRAFQDAGTAAITRMGGYVARYMGDGILAYFGYPNAYEDNAERAVRAALEGVAAVPRLDVRSGTSLAVRVGIATGLVVVGEIIGEGASEESAVLGQTPNLAARLQGVAEANQVVIDPTTRRLIGQNFVLEALPAQKLKGMAEPVPAWRVERERSTPTRFEARGRRLTRFVGRESELHLLMARWSQARNGEGQVAFLSGEAGIGKSRLVQAFQEQIADDTHVRIRYQCSPYHTNSALYPISRQLEWAAQILPGDPGSVRLDKLEALLRPTTEDLSLTVPILADLLSLPFETRYGVLDLTPQQRKERSFAALTEQLLGLATAQPVCCVIEDAHWIDPTTNELTEHLAGQIVDAPVLMLVTHRPEWRAAWTGSHSHAVSLSLGRLGRQQVTEIVRTIIGADTSEDLIERIAARTDGVPLFVEELARSVLESTEDGPSGDAEVPETLQSSLLSRLDRLGDAKEIAQIGAVLGRQFSHELLVAVAGRPEAALSAALDRLLESQLVFRRGSAPEATYTFKHALVQDTAYDSLLKRKRQQLHLQIAEALEQTSPTRGDTEPELLAHHFSEAGRTEQGIDYWQRAGEQAAKRSTNIEAAAQFGKALDLLAALPACQERNERELELLLSLASALINAKGYRAPEAEPAYARAMELCEILGETERIFPALFGRYISAIMDGRAVEALGWAREFVRRADSRGDVTLELLGHRVMAPALCVTGQPQPALDHCLKGLALYDPERDANLHLQYGSDVKVYFSWIASFAAWLLGFPDQARRYVETGTQWARQIAHPNSLSMISGWGGCLVHSLCRLPERVEAHAALTFEIAKEHDLRMWPVTARPFLDAARLEHEPDEQSIEQLSDSCADLQEQRASIFFPYLSSRLADALRRTGQLDLALARLDQAQAHTEKGGERWSGAEIPRVRGEVFRDLSRHAEAETQFNRALEIAQSQGANSLALRAATSLARLRRQQDRQREGRDVLAPVYAWFTEGFDTPDLKEAKALLGELS